MALSTITLLNTIEWSKKLNFGRASAIGNFLEPAITSANMVFQTIIGPPFAWRWNRVVTGFIAVPGQQDYTLITWQPLTVVQPGWMTIDDAGNCQVVVSTSASKQTGSSGPSWNHTKGGQTTDSQVVWNNLGSIGVPVSQQFTLGWIETAAVFDTVQSKWYEVTAQLCLSSDSAPGRPRFISAQGESGDGNITFRLMGVPDQAYPVAITIQQKPPILTSVRDTWSPIPDDYARLVNWGYLSMMWLYADDPRFAVANQKFVAQLLSTAEGLTETQRNIFLQGWQQTSGQPIVNVDRVSQGTQARGM